MAHRTTIGILAGLVALGIAAPAAHAQHSISLSRIGSFTHGGFAVGASEITAYDAGSERLFVVNAQAARIDILDLSTPSTPTLVGTIDVSPYGAVANSVAAHDGLVAVAIENATKTNNGAVAFYNTNGTHLSTVTVGALPDMLTFTPNGDWVLVANEGEPNASYTIDPEGTVSIIDVRRGAAGLTQANVRTVGFAGVALSSLHSSIRVFGPRASVAQDFEPEYIAVSHNSKTAFVTLQENNAMAVIDIKSAKLTKVAGLGFKDHSKEANALDPSDRDGGIHIAAWPIKGMYLPDAIAAFKHKSDTYLVLANEGDARDYAGFAEERRIGELTLDPTVFPNAATLKANANLGRLRVTRTKGDVNGDGDYDELYSFGARSFTIRDENGALVYDSGDDLEQITALAYPTEFNSNNDANGSFDTRSDDKGPEPEGVAVGKVHGRNYAFIGLERIGGIVVYDLKDPKKPVFVQYINTRDFSGSPTAGTAGDMGPEGIAFVSEEESPTGNALVIVGNEISGTTAIFEVSTGSNGNDMPKRVSSLAAGSAISSIVPNPSAGAVTIACTGASGTRLTLRVVDELGNIVAETKGGDADRLSTEIPAGTLAAGRYFVVLLVDGAVSEIRPLVVMK